MINRMMLRVSAVLLLLLSQCAFAGTGTFFDVAAMGTPGTVSITLCLDAKGPLTCQKYNVSALTLSISTTVPNHLYPDAGILINTPGYTIANLGVGCTQYSNGYCLFSTSNTAPRTIVLQSSQPVAPNIVVQSIILSPLQVSGSGAASPNQFQIAQNTASQTLTITYANTGNAHAAAFAVDTSHLSTGYTLNSNSCSGGAFTLAVGSLNTCQVVLNVATSTVQEEDLLLTPITSTWTGQSNPQSSVWINPVTFQPLSSVFVNIATAPPPVPTINVTIQSITLLPLQTSGNGSGAPNQWQIANATNPQTIAITYANTGNADAPVFDVNSSSLSSGYTLGSNSCSGGGFTLLAGSANTCQVLLNIATTTSGEEDFALLPATWTGGGQTTNWLNPVTLVAQASVFVNIAAIPPPLFTPAIYGFSGITSTGLSVVNGDVDTPLTPTSVTGFSISTPPGPGDITGSLYTGSAAQVTVATTQASSLHSAAIALAPACFASGAFTVPGGAGHDLSGLDLGSVGALPAGVYCFSSTAGLTGTLTLSGGPSASYTFLIGSSLTTASSSIVNLTNGTLHQNVFWDVGSAATFGTGTSFKGIVDSAAAISDDGSSTITGNVWSRSASVALIDTTVTP